ncbi:putative ABC transport system ATP-binding protein [Ferrimonas sediminum]|uniref:Putative ABC transport system ATP-binding protein n=1 Tax=Ferrimonas sediminum TaxID=718193 RepID=A0A1G8TM41_9GAMM|nr:ABC transporter ATP-binding protein [Ferrimonas sediminum]SDJ42629.1 putative ABC transport system ATP-binding protein [Ferrimonas sediminum]
MIKVHQVNLFRTQGRSQRQILDHCDLKVSRGERVAIMGESGAGKSTLLHLIAGLERPDSGHIEVNGDTLEGRTAAQLCQYRKRIGLVFQQFNLLPTLTVADNVLFQHRLNHLNDEQGVIDTIAGPLGLIPLWELYPDQLSGGEQQRVAIARALAHHPKLILADEPTGNLDEHTGDEVMALFAQLTRQLGLTLVMVTHSRRVAATLERTLHLREGRLHD